MERREGGVIENDGSKGQRRRRDKDGSEEEKMRREMED